MRFVIRVDASLQIGSGHVMRCLTLADRLRTDGHNILFVCRLHEGHLLTLIKDRGYQVQALPAPTKSIPAADEYSRWLGVTEEVDWQETAEVCAAFGPDWVVVDHYGLSALWERQMAKYCKRLMVIDDLANRKHFCDLLLDQSLNRKSSDYTEWLEKESKILAGTQYCLLRPEFKLQRELIGSKKITKVQNLIVSMGGVDKDNFTGFVLAELEKLSAEMKLNITVVLGAQAPWIAEVQEMARASRHMIEVRSNINNMAQVLAKVDLAVGAAGSSSWERCCLGVPAIIFIQSDNQIGIGRALESIGAIIVVNRNKLDQFSAVFMQVFGEPVRLRKMSKACMRVVDGLGCDRVVSELNSYKHNR